MRKIIIVFILSTLILSSCNLPTGSATADANAVATRVAATLAALQPTATQQVQVTNSLPTVEQDTITPEPSATSSMTPTATTSPDDPKLTLGSPNFQFSPASSGDPFGVASSPYEDESMKISNEVGGLTFFSKSINGGKRWRLTSPTPTNLYLEGTFKTVICEGKDNYGLVMRIPKYDSKQGYFVGISCDGNYLVDWIDPQGNGYNLVSRTPDSHIQTGSGQTNRLGVMLIDNQFKIYINGSFVTEFTDDNLKDGGHVGVYASARENPDFTVVLQELLEWTK